MMDMGGHTERHDVSMDFIPFNDSRTMVVFFANTRWCDSHQPPGVTDVKDGTFD